MCWDWRSRLTRPHSWPAILPLAMTKTGKVGTFGGIKIPTVTIFMKGFEAGVKVLQPAEETPTLWS